MTCCSAISLGFSDAGKYPQILNLISHPLSFDIEPLLEIICPSSNKACTLYTINFNSFSKSYSEEVVLTMKAIEDLCKSQDDVASYHSYPLWQPRDVWCVSCVVSSEQSEAGDRAERGADLSRVAAMAQGRAHSGNGWQCQCLPAVSVGNVPAWGPSSWHWQCSVARHQAISVTMPARDSEHSPLCRVISTGAPCHQRAGYKRGITLDLVCLRTRVVFNIGSWLLRDSPLFSRRLECVQSLRQWDWPMWRIADSRSIFYFLPRYCWLWWGQGPRTRCCDHGVRWGPLTQHPGLREEYSLAKIQNAKAVCYESKQSVVTIKGLQPLVFTPAHWGQWVQTLDTK